METTVRNTRVDGITVEVCRTTGMFQQACCEMAAFLLSDFILEMDTVSHWGTCPLPSTVKQKACKSALQALLIKHALWASVRPSEPTV